MAQTSVPAGDSCDPDFLDVMEARAWTQGKRDVETAQALLLKSDSVLDYSCFQQRVKEVDVRAGQIFSDHLDPPLPLFYCPSFSPTDNFQPTIRSPSCGPDAPGQPVLTDQTLDQMLQGMVLTALASYRQGNFNHALGGGDTAVAAGPCDVMNRVWKDLKCENLNQRPIDQWLNFSTLMTTDPRTLPTPCGETDRAQRWTAAVQASNTIAASPARSGGMDALQTYLPALAPGRCGAPIFTGLTFYAQGTEHRDAVCVAPGCYFNGAACVP